MTERTAAVTILAALNAVLGDADAYDIDEVPAERPDKYVAIDITRRWVPERRFGGKVMLPGYFLTVEYHARNVHDVRSMREKAVAALEDVILSGDIGPFTFATAAEVSARDGWFDSADTFTF